MHATIREERTLLASGFAQAQKAASGQLPPHAYPTRAAWAIRFSAPEGSADLLSQVQLPIDQLCPHPDLDGSPSRTGGVARRCDPPVSTINTAGSHVYAHGAMNGGSRLGGAVPA